MSLNLVLNAHASRGAGGPGPHAPTLIAPDRNQPLVFTDLDALARHIHRQRGRHGLKLTRTVAAYGGSDTFPAFEVRWIEPDSDHERYAFTVAIQGRPRETLEAALASTNPDIPRS